jgi:hypothetical protein
MTKPDTPDDPWKPAALREAEAQLDETMAKARQLIQKTEEKLKQIPDVDHTARPEDVTALKAAAVRPNALAELRALRKKVDAGELSWTDVLEGNALKDETVREAMRGRLGEMREIYQEAEAGASLEDILEARGVTGSVFAGGGATCPQASPPPAASEDDYFSGNNVVSQRPAPPAPPATPPQQPPTPPAPLAPPEQSAPRQPQRAARPPARAEEPAPDDYFEDPLSGRNQPKQAEPPRRGRPRAHEPDEDDYFGGPVMR